MKDERRKHHAVRTHKYGQPSLEPGHSDITPCQPRRHVLEAGEKKQMAEKEEGGKQGRVESDINWTAWQAHQIMQVQETKIDRDVIVQLSSSSPVASSKRSSTDSFSKSNFAKLLVLPPQLCQALGQLCNSPLCMVLRAARCQLGVLLAHGGHFLLSSAQRRNNNCSNRRRLPLGSPRRSVILSTAQMSQWPVVTQPGSLKHSNNATCPNLTACLDKRSHFNKTSTKTKEAEYE